jgi:hypothetical protein
MGFEVSCCQNPLHKNKRKMMIDNASHNQIWQLFMARVGISFELKLNFLVTGVWKVSGVLWSPP